MKARIESLKGEFKVIVFAGEEEEEEEEEAERGFFSTRPGGSYFFGWEPQMTHFGALRCGGARKALVVSPIGFPTSGPVASLLIGQFALVAAKSRA
ncbi:predicted protein [Coccidioides posadasii str. Silveira]|uniref:Predicted protein n=1 Tax=Coccidioides posadasii (strain RMSCC 757 / Silveira) TaxID=443226 RepID=E9CUP7_COCPS|nr:predicted protein [Coccidioides posadasii str. Silveira]